MSVILYWQDIPIFLKLLFILSEVCTVIFVLYFLFVYSHVTIVPCVTFGSVLKHLPLDI